MANLNTKKIEGIEFAYLQYVINNMNDSKTIEVKQRNLSIVSIFNDSINFNRKPLEEDSLFYKIKDFIKSDSENKTLPEIEMIYLPEVGLEEVSKYMIVIEIDSAVNFNRYFQIRHEILMAYNTLRDEYTKEKFGIAYKDLFINNQQEDIQYKLIIDRKYPIRISEAIRK